MWNAYLSSLNEMTTEGWNYKILDIMLGYYSGRYYSGRGSCDTSPTRYIYYTSASSKFGQKNLYLI